MDNDEDMRPVLDGLNELIREMGQQAGDRLDILEDRQERLARSMRQLTAGVISLSERFAKYEGTKMRKPS